MKVRILNVEYEHNRYLIGTIINVSDTPYSYGYYLRLDGSNQIIKAEYVHRIGRVYLGGE